MSEISEFYPMVRNYVAPTPPKAVMLSAIVGVLRRLCQRTHMYKHRFTLTTIAGVSDYALELLENHDLLMLAENGAREAGENRFLIAVGNDNRIRRSSVTGRPRYILFPSAAGLRLSPTPDEVYTYEIEMIIQPKLNATAVSDELFNQWGEVIAFGAAHFLSMQKGKEWYDLESTQFLKGEFERGIREAVNREAGGFANEELTMKGNGFIL